MASLRKELPVVATCVEGQLQEAERVGVPNLAVGLNCPEAVVTRPAGPDYELSDPVDRVRGSTRGLGRKPLVDVLVPIEDDLDAVVVERAPVRLDLRRRVVPVNVSGAEAWVVKVSKRAVRLVRCQVGAHPGRLSSRIARGRPVEARAVDRDHVPWTEVIAVVATIGIGRARAERTQLVVEVAEVACRGAAIVVAVVVAAECGSGS
jgi:hypothetical protein